MECGIKLGHLERMYYAQVGMFNIPLVEDGSDGTLRRLHGMTFGINCIDDDAYKGTPTPGQLFTNKYCHLRGKAVRRGPSRPQCKRQRSRISEQRGMDGLQRICSED